MAQHDNEPNFMSFVDWRFRQFHEQLQIQSAYIKTNLDEKFSNLDNTLKRMFNDMNQMKECVEQNREEIEDLKEDRGTLMDRMDKLEHKLEKIEQDIKVRNLLFMNIEESRGEDSEATTDIVLDVLNYFDSGNTWQHEDIGSAPTTARASRCPA